MCWGLHLRQRGGNEDVQQGMREAWGDKECLYSMWPRLGARDFPHCHIPGLLVAVTIIP